MGLETRQIKSVHHLLINNYLAYNNKKKGKPKVEEMF